MGIHRPPILTGILCLTATHSPVAGPSAIDTTLSTLLVLGIILNIWDTLLHRAGKHVGSEGEDKKGTWYLAVRSKLWDRGPIALERRWG